MNRRELERRIELRRADGKPIVRLLFQITSDGPTQLWDQVVRQVASRLTAQLRPDDLVGRWGEAEFMVLFNGAEDIAERRGPQVAGLVTGRYSLANGATAGVRASATILDRQLAEAPAL